MKATVKHGNPTVKRGEIGSHVELHIHAEGANEWSGVYRFNSHGMSADQFVTRVSELKAYHAAKMNRLSGFSALRMRDIVSDGTRHRIIDANLFERGSDVELRLAVYTIAPLGHQHYAFGMSLLYPAIDAVPNDDAIVTIVAGRIAELAAGVASHDALVAQVAETLEA